MFFWNSLAFPMIQQMLAIWSLVPLPFLNPSLTSGNSQFMCFKPGLENFEYYFARVWNVCIYSFNILWHCLFGIGMKTDLFQSCGHCWVFQICWHIEWSTFIASFFMIWNNSAGIPSPPLALFVRIRPKAHLTSRSRMSGSRSVITPSWLSGLWRSFLYSFSVYSCHLFLISSASVRFIPFLSFIVLIFAWNVPLVSLIFLKRSLVFPILLFSFISLHWSLKKAFWSLLAILWNSSFKWLYLFFSPLPFTSCLAICKTSSDNHFDFCISFSWKWLNAASCTMSGTSIHSSSGTLLIPWIYLSLPLCNHKGFDLGHTWMT